LQGFDLLLADHENGFRADVKIVMADDITKRLGLFPVNLIIPVKEAVFGNFIQFSAPSQWLSAAYKLHQIFPYQLLIS
jgi:hypothetical protein